MPPKLIQKSRLNSRIDIKRPSVNEPNAAGDIIKVKKQPTKKSIDVKFFQIEIEDYEQLEMEEEIDKIEPVMSRTSLLVLDYLQFKAARTIQRFVRGWLYRTIYQRKRKSAIKIQTEWRRFFCQRRYFVKVEQTLQQRLDEHYYQSARKIQALWRGWWSRQHIHNHTLLMRMQVTAGEDLLYCVAFKLHHLLRTHQIPGIYSLRNSSAFSKVEQLLASLSFKSCNEHAKQRRDHHEQAINSAKKKYTDSTYGTEIPFTGPNLNNTCVPKCMPLFTEKDADRKMARILQMYKDANRENDRPKVLKKKSKTSKKHRDRPAPTTFCGEVLRSMEKWKIIKDNKLKVEKNVFEKPENVENFLKEIESKLSFMEDKCHCGQKYLDKIEKPKQENPTNNTQPPEEFRNSYIYNSPVKLTTSLTSHGGASIDECSCFADQRVTRNTVRGRFTQNFDNNNTGGDARKSQAADGQRKSFKFEMGSTNTVPTRVTANNLNSPEDARKSATRNSATAAGVTSVRISTAKGILRNSLPTEIPRASIKK